jgi:uncharacterized protein YdaU (DUF1376 family)
VRWYKHDPDAFLAGTSMLTLEECGAYIKIIDLLYSRDGNVPDDERFMASALGCDVRIWRRIRDQLIHKGKIWIECSATSGELPGKVRAKRVEHELEVSRKLAEHMSYLARMSWEKRRQLNGPRIAGRISETHSGPAMRHAYDNQNKNTSSFSSETDPARDEAEEPKQAVVRRSELEPSPALAAVMQRKLRGPP